ncbi:helix-turn-helix domain-containing protein [Brevibacillus marinus]|uniref:helix-turn-helix transcriptional regulator n=1 Tax=Brevibacillus marinus TaxID=2496837 RepID=UPI000F8364D0
MQHKLRKKRLEHGYTLKEMSECCGYRSPSAYQMIESSLIIPPVHKAMKIAQKLNSTVEELFEYNN